MKREDKDLLLRDLSARLPYGVKVWSKYYSENVTEKFATSIRLVDERIALSSKFNREGDWYPVEEANELLIKPYLRPMSSMTEEEKRHISKMMCLRTYDNGVVYDMTYPVYTPYYVMEDCLSYLRSIHVDYSGLIEKGLAIEAPKDMYKI